MTNHNCSECGCEQGHHLYSCITLTKVEIENTAMAINSFRGEFNFLSNFAYAPVVFEGKHYPTTEHAYQAAKTTEDVLREEIRKAKTPAIAKKMGTVVPLRPNWEGIKIGVMEELLRQKFAQGTEHRTRLDATKGRKLVEGNWWHDNFWGSCGCKGCGDRGQNHLGKILMRIRDQ